MKILTREQRGQLLKTFGIKEPEWPPIMKEAHTRTHELIKELATRFNVEEQVAANEILLPLLGYCSELGVNQQLTEQPLKAVVNLFGWPEDNTPHVYFGLKTGVCTYCKEPAGGPMHVQLPPEWQPTGDM